jgi:putative endonuclease
MKSPEREDPRHRFGRTGELLAEQFLRAQGYRIVERNVKTPMGELDLVAEEGEVLVFVEVKARASEAFGGGLGAVDRRKREKLVRLASHYLMQRRWGDRLCRFDVVVIEGTSQERIKILHIKNAFDGSEGETC